MPCMRSSFSICGSHRYLRMDKRSGDFASALAYLECLIPKRQGRGSRVVTSHRLQISSATLWATAVQDDDRHAESKKRDAREERTRGETCVRTAWQTVATDGMQFQLDGIVEGRLGVHGCSVMEDYYSWSLRRLMSESCVSPWHAWAPFVPIVVYCSVALVRNAALQT